MSSLSETGQFMSSTYESENDSTCLTNESVLQEAEIICCIESNIGDLYQKNYYYHSTQVRVGDRH